MYDLIGGVKEIWRTALVARLDQYIYVFIACFLITWIATRRSSVLLNRFLALEDRVVRFLKNRDLFYVADAAREDVWLNFLRAIVGYMFFQRSFDIFYYQIVLDGTAAQSLISFIDMSSSFCMMIGLLTPIATGVLFFLHTYVHDHLLGTFTLGSCIAQLLMMTFLFLPAGRRLSLDSLIMRSRSIGAGFLEWLYAFIGFPSANRIAIVKFCVFISYGLLCMYSVYEHLRDPYWFNGTANVLLLSSNWLVRPYHLFRELFTSYGEVAIIFSMATLYIMMLWELVIIPFTLIKGYTRYFVIGWGLAFFAVSLLVLQLSWLPHFQIALFAIFFWPGFLLNRNGEKSLYLFYDDRCNLCDRTVRLITFLDWFSVVQLRPLSKNEDLIKSSGLTQGDVFDDLHGYDPKSGQVFKGYDLYIELATRIFSLFWLLAVLLLGKYMRIGPQIYAFVAKRRRKIFGTCEIPTIDLAAARAREVEAPIVSRGSRFFMAFLMTYCLFLGVYLLKFPYFSHIPGWQAVRQAVSFVGVVPPALHGQIEIIVFTPQVITMGSHYFTVTGLFEDGREVLVPYVGPEGERLDLVRDSDRLYFGHSLAWRRLMYDRDDERICYEAERDDEFLFGIFGLAERMWGEAPQSYRVDFYHQPIPDPQAAARFEYKLPPREHVCAIEAHRQEPWIVETVSPAALSEQATGEDVSTH